MINQTWSPMFGKTFDLFLDLINIFEVFLPQLLRYPNPSDPLNGEAAALMMRDPLIYDKKVREYVKRYANKNTFQKDKASSSSDGESEISIMSSIYSGSFDEDLHVDEVVDDLEF